MRVQTSGIYYRWRSKICEWPPSVVLLKTVLTTVSNLENINENVNASKEPYQRYRLRERNNSNDEVSNPYNRRVLLTPSSNQNNHLKQL
ncbi:hypothetical protein OH492_21190 [Vibrio chagasii]|nr:hypothetical protein [Vibrio chagasii]